MELINIFLFPELHIWRWRSTKSPQQYGWCLVILDDDDTIDVTTTIIVSFDESQYMEEAPTTTN